MTPGKVVDLQREREARTRTKKPRTTFHDAIMKLSELDDLICETKHPAGDFLMLGILHTIITALAVIKAPSSGGNPTNPTTRNE